MNAKGRRVQSATQLIRSRQRACVYLAVLATPGSSVREISQATRIGTRIVHAVLTELADDRLLRVERSGRGRIPVIAFPIETIQPCQLAEQRLRQLLHPLDQPAAGIRAVI